MKKITALRGQIILVDDEDYPLLSRHIWVVSSEGYARTRCGGYDLYMHRLIVAPRGSLYVDHKNHNRLDNRKKNLKEATNSENSMNRKTTKTAGVAWFPLSNKWRARITKNKIDYHLGLFNTKEEAEKARKKALKNWSNL